MAMYHPWGPYTWPDYGGEDIYVTNETELQNAINYGNGKNVRIIVANGNYRMPSFNSPGISSTWNGLSGADDDARLVIVAENQYGARFYPDQRISNGYPCLYAYNCDYLHLHGLFFDAAGYPSAWALVMGRSDAGAHSGKEGHVSHTTVSRCRIHITQGEAAFSWAGALGDPSQNILIEDNWISQSHREGLYIGYGNEFGGTPRVDGFIIRGNIIENTGSGHDWGGEGMDIKMHSRNGIIEDNIVRHCKVGTQGGITVLLISTPMSGSWPANIVVRRNIVYDIQGAPAQQDGVGIYCGANGCVIEQNVVWNCYGPDILIGNSANNTTGTTYVLYNTTEGPIQTGGWGYGGVVNTVVAGNRTMSSSAGSDNLTNRSSADFVGPLSGDADAGEGPGSGWRLRNGSVAGIDNGPSNFGNLVSDYDPFGVPRPSGNGWDYGAFEWGTLGPGIQTVFPNGLLDPATFGTPTFAPGGVSVSPTGLASTLAFGNPNARGVLAVLVEGIPPTAAFGTVLAELEGLLEPLGIPPTSVVGVPTILQEQFVTPEGIASTVAFGISEAGYPKLVVLVPEWIVQPDKLGTPRVKRVFEISELHKYAKGLGQRIPKPFRFRGQRLR